MSLPQTLRFGIQSLDKLIGVSAGASEDICGVDLSQTQPNNNQVTSSVCLIGPDGTGKSVFCLHIASRYLADCNAETSRINHQGPKILYISTDLTYEMGRKVWDNFALNTPSQRREPLIELKAGKKSRHGPTIELKHYFPSGDGNSSKSIISYLERNSTQSEVCFVDLASRTAGDDWGFVHRLLSTLETPGKGQPRHLVVLDAVEGFETLVGDLNAFGEKSSRRSRIAQVMRLATAKCHLVFVVEEARNDRFPEEFVTDVVIRLRNIETERYLRRTVEIEKTRGQQHIRGQHPFVIRDGQGSTTGNQENADEPEVFKFGSDKKHQGYVHVFSSLHLDSRTRMIDKANPREHDPDRRFAAFGIQYLDNMLGGRGERAEVVLKDGSDTRGLPCGLATALIGDSLTQKTQLGMAFLSRAFHRYAKKLAAHVREVAEGCRKIKGDEKRIAQISKRLQPVSVRNQQVTIMFTTRVIDHEKLADTFYEWLEGGKSVKAQLGNDYATRKVFEVALKKYITEYAICRRFEIHDISAPILMHIFQRNIEQAQRKVSLRSDQARLWTQEKLFQASWRIRVVIDDLNSFRDTFPEISADPLMLPSLISMLEKEGVTTLIIDTQTSGSPDLPITERFDSSVRELVKNRIYTWRLPFYGENRVAISIIPPISKEYRGVIRELRWETKDEATTTRSPSKVDRASTVDPHFELYSGLETGQARPVPLEVSLYAETPNFKKYIETEERFFREVFAPVATAETLEPPRVINAAEASEYDALRDSCHLQRGTRMDHTKILQVDEFWLLRRDRSHRTGAFREQWKYLDAVTARRNAVTARKDDDSAGKQDTQRTPHCQPDLIADPFEVFQPSLINPKTSTLARSEFHRWQGFDPRCGYDFQGKRSKASSELRAEEKGSVDRVPFTWDFGFLLCNETAWREAFPLEVKFGEAYPKKARNQLTTVEDVWDNLRMATGGKSQSTSVSWREFLAASKVVAEFQSYRTSTPATTFDFTMLMPESFSCLILEMWLSEALISLSRHKARCRDEKLRKDLHEKRRRIVDRVHKRRWRWERDLEPRNLLIVLKQEKGKTLDLLLEERRKGQVDGYSLELYKVWLLLIEALSFSELVDSSSHLNFEFKSKDVSTHAVSARHWYKSASTFIDSLSPEQLEYNWIPVRLPGHFSVRADWFLAVAGGSRSNRLADHALDLLSSQRANITRLQEGVGLPTRMLTEEKNRDTARLRTRLIAAEKPNPLANVDYEKLRGIGASNDEPTAAGEEFYWLWRSGIWAYNRHSRVWQKWLNRTLLWWHSLRQRHGSNWTKGFEVYDLLNDIEFSETKERADAELAKLKALRLNSWNEFRELRDILIAELEQVSISEAETPLDSVDSRKTVKRA